MEMHSLQFKCYCEGSFNRKMLNVQLSLFLSFYFFFGFAYSSIGIVRALPVRPH